MAFGLPDFDQECLHVQYLLVPSTGSELDRPAVQMALRAADPSSAHIEFLHVRMDVRR